MRTVAAVQAAVIRARADCVRGPLQNLFWSCLSAAFHRREKLGIRPRIKPPHHPPSDPASSSDRSLTMRFAPRSDGTRPTRHDDDAPVFEILGTQECHNLNSMRKFKQTWSVALNAAGLPSAKITVIWDYMLDEERPMWWGDEAGPNNSSMDWTTADKPLYHEYYELTEMLHFAWTALRKNVRHPCPRAQLAGASRGPRASRRCWTTPSRPSPRSSRAASSRWGSPATMRDLRCLSPATAPMRCR